MELSERIKEASKLLVTISGNYVDGKTDQVLPDDLGLNEDLVVAVLEGSRVMTRTITVNAVMKLIEMGKGEGMSDDAFLERMTKIVSDAVVGTYQTGYLTAVLVDKQGVQA